MDNKIDSFLGVNSETGFYSLYEDFLNKRRRVYIIKGGPGTGKSTLMRRVGKAAQQQGRKVEYLHCSSDPNSLDGVYIPDIDTCILDGTPPHVLEPPYPGAVGNIIDMYQFWDTKKLEANAAQIKDLNAKISALFERTYLYLGAAGKLQRDVQQIGSSFLNRAKLRGYTERLCNKYLKSQTKQPSEEKRFLSSITPDGLVFYGSALVQDMEKTLVFDDEYGLSAKVLEVMRLRALKNGHSITCCYGALNPLQLEHIVFHDISLAVATSSSLHRIEAAPYSRINIGRFLDTEQEKACKIKLGFLKKCRDEIISEAINLLELCHSTHDELEEYYKAAVDFAALDAFTQKITAELLT